MNKMSYSRFFVLLKQIPQADKEEMVWTYSNMKTNSLNEFATIDPDGYNRMINDMQNIVNGINAQDLKSLRSAILHRLQKHGVDTTNWANVNRFMEQPRIAGKKLYEMSVPEMQDLIKKLESILSKDKKHQENLNRLACLN